MLGIGSVLPEFEIVGVKPGFNNHEENGESAFETINNKSFDGKWKVIYFYPKDFTFVCPTEITAFSDKSFTFITKTPPASYFLKKAAKLKKGGQTPGRSSAGQVTIAQCKEIAETKQKDLNAVNIEGAIEMIKGSARSMGLEVVE